jgi:hypothetical protein
MMMIHNKCFAVVVIEKSDEHQHEEEKEVLLLLLLSMMMRRNWCDTIATGDMTMPLSFGYVAPHGFLFEESMRFSDIRATTHYSENPSICPPESENGIFCRLACIARTWNANQGYIMSDHVVFCACCFI